MKLSKREYVIGYLASLIIRAVTFYDEIKQAFCKHEPALFGYVCIKCGKDL